MHAARKMALHIGLSASIGLSGALVAGPAEAASTGTVWVRTTTDLEYKAAAGHQNNLVITVSGGTVTIDDSAKLKPGAGCRAVPGHTTVVTCALANPDLMVVTLGDNNDTLVNKSNLRLSAYGGAGNDTLTGGARSERLFGGAGNDRVTGNGGSDWVAGDSGHDLVDAGPGTDQVRGGTGNDTLLGRAGSDTLLGGAGRDVIWAGADADQLDDSAPGTTSADVFHGGTGRDLLSYSGRTKPVSADADGRRGDDGERGEGDTVGTDIETLLGGFGADTLRGTPGADFLLGSLGNDSIAGGGGDDRIEGGSGWDVLRGDAGNDHVVGGSGADRIFGGNGDDTLYGYLPPDLPVEPDADTLGGDIDGGPNATALGDLCLPGAGFAAISCER